MDIITPYTRACHLEETYDSVLQHNDVRWCRLIQADGDPPGLPDRIRSDERVSNEANSGSCGPALTRNHALMRSTAPFVFALDDDDLPCPGRYRPWPERLSDPLLDGSCAQCRMRAERSGRERAVRSGAGSVLC
ncbi:glycosyltransferase family 2 protein [Allorhizocola rhizosphaerae]|uniref:glycosyltransferase family 2 protein n=1 Tax=Allorhizocola rhizosphaerae TaxID=1872709 RepID=UPI000E3BA817|nr:glycosyltransferase family A protein [Allorhizocola rhizosphaerae]